jgi:hypothetical protein
MSLWMMRQPGTDSTAKYCGNGDETAQYAKDAVIFHSGDSASYLKDVVGVSHRGRQVVIGTNTTDSATHTSLIALFCGGPATVNLPGRVTYAEPYQRSSWTLGYIPIELPAALSSWTTSGSGTDTITTDGLLQRAGSSNTRISTIAPTSTVANGMIVRYVMTAVSGGSTSTEANCLKIRSGNSSSAEYEVSIRFSMSGFLCFDVQGSSNIGTAKTDVAPSGGIEILAAVVGGNFSCFYRAASAKSDRVWKTYVTDDNLTNGGGSVANLITFGIAVNAIASFKVHEFWYMSDDYTRAQLGDEGYTNPDDLFGLGLARRGLFTHLTDGVRISGVDGSAMKADEFDINTAYEHPISRAFHRESPTPRAQWRSTAVSAGTAVAEQLIPFVLNKDATSLGAAEQSFGSTLCYASFKGINWQTATIQRWDVGTTAWVTVATIDNGFTTPNMVRRGNEVVATTGGSTSTSRYFYENECKGWTMAIGTTYRKISGNTAGNISQKSSGTKVKTATFFLENIDGSEPTGPAATTLIPDSCAITFHMGLETGGGFAVRIASQRTADDDIRIGHLQMGRLFVFGEDYEHGRILMYESGDQTEDSPSGVRRSVEVGPGGHSLRLAWTEPIDTTQVQGTTTLPDYILSTSTSGNDPVAVRADTPFSLLGLLQGVGASTPLTYFPRIAVSSGSQDSQQFSRRYDHMIGQLASAVQAESVVGSELDSSAGEALRVATVIFEEIR